MVLRLSFSANSDGLGAAAGAGWAGAGCIWAGAGAGAAGAAVGAVGAGATAPVVAGRFGHPARKRVRRSSGTTKNAGPRRCTIASLPPWQALGELSLEKQLNPITDHGRRGDHAGLEDCPGPPVTTCCSEPSASMVKTWVPPRRFEWKERCRPLGDHVALSFSPGPAVRRRRFEPSGLTAHRSWLPWREVKTMVSPLGDQRGWVLKPLEVMRRTLVPWSSIT